MRIGSCFTCTQCKSEHYDSCLNKGKEEAGEVQIRQVVTKSVVRQMPTRNEILNAKVALAKKATLGTFLAVEQAEETEFAFKLCMVTVAGIV